MLQALFDEWRKRELQNEALLQLKCANFVNELSLKAGRKDKALQALQATLKKVVKEKGELEDKIIVYETERVERTHANDVNETFKIKEAEIEELRETVKNLKAKCKRKSKKIKQYKLALDDYVDDGYDDDPDEEDGEPDPDSDGAEDIDDVEMIDIKELKKQAAEEDDSDSDSDFELSVKQKGRFICFGNNGRRKSKRAPEMKKQKESVELESKEQDVEDEDNDDQL